MPGSVRERAQFEAKYRFLASEKLAYDAHILSAVILVGLGWLVR